MLHYDPIPIEDVRAARERLPDGVVRTPLVRLNADPGGPEIWLKLESLQPIGSFKIRGASNAIALADPAELRGGVWTASAGNMAQGVAWCARRAGVACAVVVPETAPLAKLSAIERLGARAVQVPLDTWFEVFSTRRFEGMEGLFVHPFSDPAVMAGNGTIGLEILEDLPEAAAVVVPYGGGGLSCGIASAVRALSPATAVFASEASTAAPLAASLEAGAPVEVEYRASFVDGIGAPRVYPEMFDLARRLLAGSIVVGLEETAAAVRLLSERNHVVAEGAGGTSVAAALTGRAGPGPVVAVVSGGNVDASKLATILGGGVP